MEKTKEETKEETKERYTFTEVVTDTAPAIQDNVNNAVYRGEEILLEMLNKLDKIEKAVG